MADAIREIEISPPAVLYVGNKWQFTIPLTSKSGSVTPSAVACTLYAEESTSDVLSNYASGSGSYSGNNVTTPLVGVGTGTILPGKYTLYVDVTFNGGLILSLLQRFEFLEKKG